MTCVLATTHTACAALRDHWAQHVLNQTLSALAEHEWFSTCCTFAQGSTVSDSYMRHSRLQRHYHSKGAFNVHRSYSSTDVEIILRGIGS